MSRARQLLVPTKGSLALPAVPTNLTAVAVAADQIDLAWDAVPGATGYKIERGVNGVDFVQIDVVGAVTTYSDTGLASGNYYYRVRGINTAGDGAYSNISNASVQTYWIDYKNGNDTTGDGSTGTPWKTIVKALSVAVNNDTVLLRGDSVDSSTFYRERNFNISETGFTLAADTGHTPVIVGSNEYTSWSKTAGRTNVYEAAFTSTLCWKAWNGSTILASVADVATCDSTPNSRYFDDTGDKLYVNIGGGIPTSIEVYDVVNVNAFTLSGVNGTLKGLDFRYGFQAASVSGGGSTIQDCSWSLWVDYAKSDPFSMLRLGGASHSLIGCTFTGTYDVTICVRILAGASAVSMSGCTLTGAYRAIYVTDNGGHVFTNCTISNIGLSFDAAGIKIESVVTDATVTGCTFYNAGKYGLSFACSTTGLISGCEFYGDQTIAGGTGANVGGGGSITVSDCVFHDLWADGLSVGGTGTIDVSDCIFYDCGHGFVWIVGTGAKVISRCVGYLTRPVVGATASTYGYIIDPGSVVQVSFYHCIVANLNFAPARTHRIGFLLASNGTVTYKNCVALNCLTGFKVGLGDPHGYTPTIDADYNGLYGNGTDFEDGELINAYGAGANNVTADPLFTDAANNVFALLSGSPYIDAGVAIAGINDDYNGAAPDIGRYEKA